MPHLLSCFSTGLLISRRFVNDVVVMMGSVMIRLLVVEDGPLIMYNSVDRGGGGRSMGKGWSTGTLHRLIVRLFSASIMISFMTSLTGVIIRSMCFILSYLLDLSKKKNSRFN